MSQSRADAHKPTVLVVDDDRGTVELLQMMLHVRGYRALVAYSGLEAVAMVEELVNKCSPWQPLPVDLILLDIMMPGIDGFKVCQYVKSDPRLKYIPVIMVTALENTSDKVAAVEFGADGYITKPFLPEELGSAIKAKLQIKQREEELLRRNRELEALDAVSAAASSTLDPHRVLEQSLEALMEHTDLAAAVAYLYNEAENQLERVFQKGIERPPLLSMQENRVSQIIRTQQAQVKEDLSEDVGFQIQGARPSAFMGIPLRGVEHSLGALEIYHQRPFAFGEREQEIYNIIGDRIGCALENAQIFQHAQTLLAKSCTLSTVSA